MTKRLFVAVAALLMASAAFGQLTMSTVAPTGPFEAYSDGATDGKDVQWRADAHRILAQTFTVAADYAIDTVTVAVRQEPSLDRMTAGMSMKVDIFSTTDPQSNVIGTTIVSVSGITPEFEKGTLQFMTFDLPNTLLTAGYYGLAFDFTGENSNYTTGGHKLGGDSPAGWQFNGSGSYAGGSFIAYDAPGGTESSGASGDDFWFYITSGPLEANKPGDADLDGDVDFADYQALEAGFGKAGVWATGDFDATNFVDFADYQILEANFGKAAVPEPATLSLLALAGLGLLRRRS